MTSVIIGLDVGTTAVKAVAFAVGDPATSATHSPLAESQAEQVTTQPEPGWQVQDLGQVLAAVDSALSRCAADLPRHTEVLGVSLSVALHALIGLDADCVALTPVITWADGRSAEDAAWIRTHHDPVELLHRSGTPVHPMSPMVKLRWITREEPELSRRVRWWVGLKEVVLHHLTGTLAAEISCGSASGLLDVRTRQWDPQAAELAGISTDRLADVVSTTTRFELASACANRVGLAVGCPVVIGAGDGPLGNLGTGAIVPGVVGLSLGTSGAARMIMDGPTFDPDGRLFSYALTDDLWVSGGAISNGASAIHWAARMFAPEIAGQDGADTVLLDRAARLPAGADGVLALPFVLPERSPMDPGLTATVAGLRFDHGPEHAVRATIEGVCRQVAVIVTTLNSITPVEAIRATGSPFGHPLWQQVMAGHLDAPMVVPSSAGGTALGAAALGAYALGVADSLPAALAALGGPVGTGDVLAVPVDPADAQVYRTASGRAAELLESYLLVAESWTATG